jgi:hypothetical protein
MGKAADPNGRTRVLATVGKDCDKQIRTTIDDFCLFAKAGRRIDHAEHFYDPRHLIKISGRLLQHGDELQFNVTRMALGLVCRYISPVNIASMGPARMAGMRSKRFVTTASGVAAPQRRAPVSHSISTGRRQASLEKVADRPERPTSLSATN